jgi:hypothetical protein
MPVMSEPTKKQPYQEMGNSIRRLRLKAGIDTQKELLNALSFSGVIHEASVWSKIESGERRLTRDALIKVISFFREKGVLINIQSAQEIIRLSGYASLDDNETRCVFENISSPISLDNQVASSDPQVIDTNQLENLHQDEFVKLGKKILSLGIVDMTDRWTSYIDFEGIIGQRLKLQLKNAVAPATWYIVTISPEGMTPWLHILRNAVEERGVDIKWVYHAKKTLGGKGNDALKAQWEMIYSRVTKWQERVQKGQELLESQVQNLFKVVQDSCECSKVINLDKPQKAGNWELYESKIAHPYFAFFSVPTKHLQDNRPHQAPPGTFGFIHLYPMFPHTYDSRPGIYLEAPGQCCDYYYWSVTELFSEGVARDYLYRTWPMDNFQKE